MNNLIPLRDFQPNDIPAEYNMVKTLLDPLKELVPLNEVVSKPTNNIQLTAKEQKAFSAANAIGNKKDLSTPMYTYKSALDYRYQNPTEGYSKLKDTEAIYGMNQSTSGRIGRLSRQWVDDFNFSFMGEYEGIGHTINSLQNSIADLENPLTALEEGGLTTTALIKASNDRMKAIEDPLYQIYGKGESAPFFSTEGTLGQAIGSSGFTFGGIGRSVVDLASGSLIKAALASEVGAIALVPFYAAGAAATNDTVRTFVGEKVADTYLGWLTSATLGAALTGKATPSSMLKDVKNMGELKSKLWKAITNPENLALDPSSMMKSIGKQGYEALVKMGKAFKNINTYGKAAVGLTYGYLSSSSESALEAFNAQLEFIDNQYQKIIEEGRVPTEREIAKIKERSVYVTKDVNRLNRIILSASNMFEVRGIFKNPLINPYVKKMGIEYVEKEIAEATAKKAFSEATGSFTTSITKNQLRKRLGWELLYDSGIEGVEEISQDDINKGVKDYYSKELKDRDLVHSWSVAAHNSFTEDALYQGMIGAMTGIGSTAVRSAVQMYKANKGDESFTKQVLGYDKEGADAVVENLNKNLNNLRLLYSDFTKLSTDKKVDQNVLKSHRESIEDTRFNMLLGLYQNGSSEKIQDIIDSIYKDMTPDYARKMYGDIKVDGVSVSTMNDAEVTTFLNNEKTKIKNDVKEFALDQHNISELYDNPFDLSLIDQLFTGIPIVNLITGKKKTKYDDKEMSYDDKVALLREKTKFTQDLINTSVYQRFKFKEQSETFKQTHKELIDYLDKNKDSFLHTVLKPLDDEDINIFDYITQSQYGTKQLLTRLDEAIETNKAALKLENETNTNIQGVNRSQQIEDLTKRIEGLEGIKSKFTHDGKKLSAVGVLFNEMNKYMGLDTPGDLSDENKVKIKDNFTVAHMLKTLGDIKQSSILLDTGLNGLRTNSKFKASYINSLFEIKKKHLEEVKREVENIKKGSSKSPEIVQPSDNGRTALSQYSINKNGIWFTEKEGDPPKPIGKGDDITVIRDHIEANNPSNEDAKKALEEYKNERRDQLKKDIESLQKEIDKLDTKLNSDSNLSEDDKLLIQLQIQGLKDEIQELKDKALEDVKEYEDNHKGNDKVEQMLEQYRTFAKEYNANKEVASVIEYDKLEGIVDQDTLNYLSVLEEMGIGEVVCN